MGGTYMSKYVICIKGGGGEWEKKSEAPTYPHLHLPISCSNF